MVGAAFAQPTDWGKKWVVFLGLSVCANAILLTQVHPIPKIEPIYDIPILKVNLMTLARPAVSSPPVESKVEPVKVPPPPPPEAVRVKPVVTTPFAPEKVAVIPKLPQPKAEPVKEAKAQPVPRPMVRPAVVLEPPIETKAVPPIEMAKIVPEIVEKIPEKKIVRKVVAKPEPRPAPEPKVVATLPDTSKGIGEDNSTVIHEARYRHQVPPSYPRRALDLGHQGTVTLHAEVLPSGTPRDLKIAKSSGHRLLDMAAMAAVKKWKFEPTSVDGNAVVSWVRVPVNFVIH
ncbi:energy transducer TonB [Sneathiella sp. HT1-7]|uniref:energy transducer TonB n=1 Tax=Sneathiella sp. HT1-7 TaxID=2887192 RepID=UPI001D139610|nr:energy transducer TonB [Sneathiella sp. HT1-7]MCC3305273.1 energy transducer TonB [Sneathiella sp. HT1-7]